jgi:hypothetical protein
MPVPHTNDSDIDWPALARLRQDFLAGTAGADDYWRQASDLASYDATFAQRIGWKWDFVLGELCHRGWEPPGGELLDWGCGSGVAARAFLDHFGTGSVAGVRFWDRSAMAMAFAARRAMEKYPGLSVHTGAADAPALVLLSHVLSELAPAQTELLLQSLLLATTVLWVEPGSYESSRALIAIRERLRDHFQLIAPCPHQGHCGILAPGNDPHWCHFFAAPPPGVFSDPFWGHFARVSGVDLRSLPVSYLVLDRRPAAPLPPDTMRVLGRPRLFKPAARILGCDCQGVRERELTRREFPDLYRLAKKEEFPSLNSWRCDARRILAMKPFP